MTYRKLACLAALILPVVAAQEPADSFYDAIRNDRIPQIRELLKTHDVNLRDKHGATPLMYAAAAGSAEAMKLLLASGADVNAKDAFDATALMWCASQMDKVRLLIEKGADVNARSKEGRTPLLIAASQDGASDIVELLLEKRADPSPRGAQAKGGRRAQITPLIAAAFANDTRSVRLLLAKGAEADSKDETGFTALMNAAGNGNVEVVRILLDRGADVNAVTARAITGRVKNGPLALGLFTPLLCAVAYGGPSAVKLLLDAGAQVNARDVRGMTPLMLAVASDRPDPRVVRLLLSRGADPALKSLNGETAADWARKFSYRPVLEALKIDSRQTEAQAEFLPAGSAKPVNAAAAKSVALLQRTSGSFFQTGGCISCHSQNLTAMAMSAARTGGIKVEDNVAAEQLKAAELQWAGFAGPLLQHLDPPGGFDTLSYAILHLAAGNIAPGRTTDAMIQSIAADQQKEGNWHESVVARPPIQDGDFSPTARCIRALRIYGMPGRKAEFDGRIRRAAAWLRAATPRTAEDANMRLLGLKWAGENPDAAELMTLQRRDRGWAQTPELASDAYATGQTLYTLRELGVPANDPHYSLGVEFLVRTQLDDGSWHVRSRAPKFQPYFQSGFPHDHDQWISTAATSWAAMGLAYAASDKSQHAALR